jgi:hypothetical protein
MITETDLGNLPGAVPEIGRDASRGVSEPRERRRDGLQVAVRRLRRSAHRGLQQVTVASDTNPDAFAATHFVEAKQLEDSIPRGGTNVIRAAYGVVPSGSKPLVFGRRGVRSRGCPGPFTFLFAFARLPHTSKLPGSAQTNTATAWLCGNGIHVSRRKINSKLASDKRGLAGSEPGALPIDRGPPAGSAPTGAGNGVDSQNGRRTRHAEA